MSLDVLLEPIPSRDVPRLCKVGVFRDGVPEKYQVAIDNLFALKRAEGGMTDEELTARLRDAGFDGGETVVRRHRKNACVCN